MKSILLRAVCILTVTAFLITSSASASVKTTDDDSDIKYHLDIGFNQGWSVETSKALSFDSKSLDLITPDRFTGLKGGDQCV
jgi:hypothetical protein